MNWLNWQAVAAIVGIVIGVGGVISTFLFYGMVHGQKDSVEFLTTANEGLRGALEDSNRKCDIQIAELKAHHEADMRNRVQETAELRGQIAVLTGTLGDNIARVVVEGLGTKIAGAVVDGMRPLIQDLAKSTGSPIGQ